MPFSRPRYARLVAWIGLGLFVQAAVQPPSSTAADAAKRTVYYMLAIDGGSGLPGLDTNKTHIQVLLSSLSPFANLQLLDLASVSPDGIKQSVATLTEIGENDVVFFYYAGHGRQIRQKATICTPRVETCFEAICSTL